MPETPPGGGPPLWGEVELVGQNITQLRHGCRMCTYLEAGEGTRLPPSDPLDVAAPLGVAVVLLMAGPGLGAAGTAAHQWRDRPPWSSGESTPHQSLCSPGDHTMSLTTYWCISFTTTAAFNTLKYEAVELC